ncbi:venom dipeptidyl peptidase 4 [Uranotaenia lowii]|uniref:venom dipeptidyl peptidase 4 n=1 Tax=Uranotaenia lowii TaxID=190385 RepID=UPI00247A2153|nr:venom dipeptidyl peptidase 4 [Uranotaenia lowii]
MNLLLVTVLGVILVASHQSLAAPAKALADEELKGFKLEDVVPNTFGQRGFGASWLSGSELLYRVGDYVKYDVATDTETVLLAESTLSAYRGASVQFLKPDFTWALIRYDVKTVFRHSTLSKYTLLDISTGNTYTIADGQDVSICVLAPNHQSLAYIKDNNVYYKSSLTSSQEVALTTDGIPGIIYNGVPDWVYEEEVFGTDATLWFSNDGSHVAIASFDDREVPQISYPIYGNPGDDSFQYPEEYLLRYPKANSTNPLVSLRVMDLTVNPRVWKDLAAPVDVVGEDHILTSVNWIGTNLGAMWMNRRQNVASYQGCNVGTGACREMIQINEPSGWCDISTFRCTDSGSRCHFLANFNGWRTIWEFNGFLSLPRFVKEQVTVTSIIGYDEAKGIIYYTAVSADAPQERHVYANADCLTCDLLKDTLTNDTPCSYASASFSSNFEYFAGSCSGPTPSYTRLYRTNDLQLIDTWEDNRALRARLDEYKKTQVRFLKVPVTGGFHASVRFYLPPEIDFENPENNQEKYPMIVQVYGGPNSARVIDTFTVGFGDYLTTTKKIIYCQIDGRGTANQGYEFLFTMNNALGTVEIEDQIAVTKYLQDHYSFIDRDRTGIWGWSYGGYVTSLALEKDAETVFKCGISVAPVTSWMFYDSIYTERFMGMPTVEDNQVGYNRSDVSRYVDGMKNHMFLLIHGNADDNVHYQNSMVFVRALVDEDVEFEQMSYPDEAHGLTGVQRHLYHTMDHFWNECFDL